MQGEEMNDIAHDVEFKKKRYEVGGREGDNANEGGGGIYTQNLVKFYRSVLPR